MSFKSSATSAASQLPATGAEPASSPSLRPIANLNLIEAQRSQIRSIFQDASVQGLSQDQVRGRIEAVLTPAQRSQLQSDLLASREQAAPPVAAAETPAPASSPVATLPNGVTETDIRNQVAAANAVILNQFRYEVSQ